MSKLPSKSKPGLEQDKNNRKSGIKGITKSSSNGALSTESKNKQKSLNKNNSLEDSIQNLSLENEKSPVCRGPALDGPKFKESYLNEVTAELLAPTELISKHILNVIIDFIND